MYVFCQIRIIFSNYRGHFSQCYRAIEVVEIAKVLQHLAKKQTCDFFYLLMIEKSVKFHQRSTQFFHNNIMMGAGSIFVSSGKAKFYFPRQWLLQTFISLASWIVKILLFLARKLVNIAYTLINGKVKSIIWSYKLIT